MRKNQNKTCSNILPDAKDKIYTAYCKGESRIKIMRSFKISYGQFVQIIHDSVRNENQERIEKMKLHLVNWKN